MIFYILRGVEAFTLIMLLKDNTKPDIYTYVKNTKLADFAVVNRDNPNSFVKHYSNVDKQGILSDYGIDIGNRSGHLFLFLQGR